MVRGDIAYPSQHSPKSDASLTGSLQTAQPAASGTAVITWSAYQLDDGAPKLLATASLQTVRSTDGEPATTVACGPDGSALVAIEMATIALSPDEAAHRELLRLDADTFAGGYRAVDTRSTDTTTALADLDIDPSTIILVE